MLSDENGRFPGCCPASPGFPRGQEPVGLALRSCWMMGSGFPVLGAGDSSSSRGAALLSE